MRKHSLPFIVTSNAFLLFPIVAAFYVQEWLFFIFACAISVASVGFHYTYYYNKTGYSFTRFILRKKKYKNERGFRISDWSLAIIGVLYVFYYIFASTADMDLKWLFAALFLANLIFFISTFAVGNYNKYHPWFHVFAQTLLGFIVLFL